MTGSFTPLRARAAALLLSANCVACSSPTDVQTQIEVGVIAPGVGITARVIVAPDSVRIGEQFSALISTYGSSSCTRAHTALAYTGSAYLDLSVYDARRVSGGCTRDLRAIVRDVPIRFTDVGVATIRVHGRAAARTAAGQDSLVVVERRVVVW